MTTRRHSRCGWPRLDPGCPCRRGRGDRGGDERWRIHGLSPYGDPRDPRGRRR